MVDVLKLSKDMTVNHSRFSIETPKPTAKDFLSSFGFIIAFIITALLVGSFVGEKALYAMLAVLVISMVLLNFEKIFK